MATDRNKMDAAAAAAAAPEKADRKRCRDCEFRSSLGGKWGVGLTRDSGCAEVTGPLNGLGAKE